MIYDSGLILEGGGMRGIYTTGVLDFFMEHDIYFRNIYGVSAGACHACSYVSRQHGRAYNAMAGFIEDKRYCSFSSLLKTGDIFGADFIYHLIPDELLPYDYDAADSYEGRLYVVATCCETGKPEYFRISDFHRDMIKVRASASLPLVSRTVSINGRPYLDGGISDSIPLARSVADGNSRNVVILTREKNYRKTLGRGAPLVNLKYRHQYPEFARAQINRHNVYNRALRLVASEKKAGSAFVIRPAHTPEVGRIEKDPVKLLHLYRAGYKDAAESYDALRAFLSR